MKFEQFIDVLTIDVKDDAQIKKILVILFFFLSHSLKLIFSYIEFFSNNISAFSNISAIFFSLEVQCDIN